MKRLGRIVGLATELGMTMGLTAAGFVIVGLWAGRWLDAKLGTRPFATMLLSVTGAVAGQFAIYRLATRSARRSSGTAPGAWRARGVSAAAGLGLKVCVLVTLPGFAGFGLGLWIDRMAGTTILFTVLLALGGFAVGLVACLRLISALRSGTSKGR